MTVLSKLDKLNKRLKLVAVAFFPLTVVSIIYGWYFRGTVEREHKKSFFPSYFVRDEDSRAR